MLVNLRVMVTTAVDYSLPWIRHPTLVLPTIGSYARWWRGGLWVCEMVRRGDVLMVLRGRLGDGIVVEICVRH
jgi:hypothetical protein